MITIIYREKLFRSDLADKSDLNKSQIQYNH